MNNEDTPDQGAPQHYAPSDYTPVNASAVHEAQQPPVTHTPTTTVHADGSVVQADSFGCVTVAAPAATA